MRAARYYGIKDIRVEEVPEPVVQPGQIKIAPAFVGICGTDLHEYLGGPNFCPVKAHAVTGESIPITLGHEFSGVIKEVGEGVEGFNVGQSCAIQPTIYCGKCAACEVGARNICHNGGFVGLSGGGGGLSEAVCVNASHVFPLPSGISLEAGALVEPLAVAWHAISAAPDLTPDSTVLIIGGGPIGLAAILCLRGKGVKTIIVSEVATARQQFAKEFGASHVLNPLKDDLGQVIKNLTDGKGVDVSFDCAGVPASIKSACMNVRAKGTVVNVAIWEKEVPFNPNWVTWKESSFKSVLGYGPEDFKAVIEHLANGTITPQNMITARIGLENVVKEGIGALISDKDNHVKILVDIEAGSSK